jgi:hypothetical protein
MRRVRRSIEDGTFAVFRAQFATEYKTRDTVVLR